MIDLTTINIDSTLDLSLIIFIIGIFSYYFGKIIEEVKPTKETRQVTYMSGIFFILIFVALPLLVIYEFSNNLIIIPGTFWWLFGVFILQTLLFFILHKKIQTYNLVKSGYSYFFGEKVEEYTSNLINSLGISGSYEGWNAKKLNEKIFLSKLSNNFLFVIITVMIWLFVNVLVSSENLIFQFLIFFYLILGLSNAAILYGWNQVQEYPLVNVLLLNEKVISGRLMKIEEDYVNIRDKKKVFHINKEQIRFIENKDIVNTSKIEKKIAGTSRFLKKISGNK